MSSLIEAHIIIAIIKDISASLKSVHLSSEAAYAIAVLNLEIFCEFFFTLVLLVFVVVLVPYIGLVS